MKKYILTGIVILGPIVLSILIFVWLIDLLTAPFIPIAEYLLSHLPSHVKTWLFSYPFVTLGISRVLVLLFLIILTFLLGFLARRYLFDFFLHLTQRLFLRIPVVKVIYRLSRDMTKAIFDPEQKAFQHTALVSFPFPDSQAIGFVTGSPPEILKKYAVETDLVVFVPTAPHPISGFVLLYPQKLVKPIDVSVEDAFKFIISCGLLPPEAKQNPNSP